MRTDLNTLLTALYVRIDDYLAPSRRAGRPPRLTDAELLTLAVAQVLLGVRSEARWLRLVPAALPGAFPYLPGQSGYNKRLRAALPLLKRVIRMLAADTDLWGDPVWLVDSTPGGVRPLPPHRTALEPGRLRRLRLLRLPLPLLLGTAPAPGLHSGRAADHWALAHPKLDERQVLMAVLDQDRHLLAARPGLLLIADKGYASAELDSYLDHHGVELLRPAYRNRAPRPGQQLLAPIRQLIESVHDTLKGQLDLELHGGRTLTGVATRVAQRILALTAAIWHNRATGQPITRSLIAYDH